MNGFLNILKPPGMTSAAVVAVVRRMTGEKRVGHAGTLDPEAAGVLPIMVGKAARLFDYLVDKEKEYVAECAFGQATDTQDATGQIIAEHAVDVGERELRAVLPRFVGEIEQIPPMYSAIKRDGKRMYQLARKGETVELEPRKCRVDAVEYLERTGENRYRIRVDCGKGVYIRTLCHDIGRALGCGAHMASLERTAAGIFRIEDALTREQIDDLSRTGGLEEALIPLDAPLGHLPAVHVGESARHAVINGNPLKQCWLNTPVPADADAVRIYLSGEFAGIGKPEPDGSVRFRCMMLEVKP